MNAEARQYIDAVPEGKAHFEQLHALIMSLYPATEIGMSYRVPTYKTKSGWVAVGYWKYGLSLHIEDAPYLDELKDRYRGITLENGGLHLKISEALPLALLKQIIRHAIGQPPQIFGTARDSARHGRASRPYRQYGTGNRA